MKAQLILLYVIKFNFSHIVTLLAKYYAMQFGRRMGVYVQQI